MLSSTKNPKEKLKYKQVLEEMKQRESLQFWIGNPSIDLISGVLDFYPSVNWKDPENEEIKCKSTIIAAISIPNFKEITEFASFIKDYEGNIPALRVLKTNYVEYYCILLKVDTVETASDMLKILNEKQFNFLEEDRCIFREVKEVKITHQEKTETKELEIGSEKNPSEEIVETVISGTNEIFYLTLEKHAIKKRNQWQAFYNLDNSQYCPICLEPLLFESEFSKKLENNNSQKPSPMKPTKSITDSPQIQAKSPNKKQHQKEIETADPSPIIGTLCGHYFHMNCLEKWNDSICPVCRYYQHPQERSKCDICASDDNLWQCIICGFIGCTEDGGPLKGGHIREHYESTNHIYAVEVETKCAFDFSKGEHVHRLLQNQVDGKIIEQESNIPVEDQENVPQKAFGDFNFFEKKIDQITQEYNLLLASQYQSQKNYFEGMVEEFANDKEKVYKYQREELEDLQENNQKLEKILNNKQQEFTAKREEFLVLKDQFMAVNKKKQELEAENKRLLKLCQGINDKESAEKDQKEKKLEQLRTDIRNVTNEIKDIQIHISNSQKFKRIAKKEGIQGDSGYIIVSDKGKSKRRK